MKLESKCEGAQYSVEKIAVAISSLKMLLHASFDV